MRRRSSTGGYGKGIQKKLIDEEPSVQAWPMFGNEHKKTDCHYRNRWWIEFGDSWFETKIRNCVPIPNLSILRGWSAKCYRPRVCTCVPSLGAVLYRGPLNMPLVKWRQEWRLTVKFSMYCHTLYLGAPRSLTSPFHIKFIIQELQVWIFWGKLTNFT